MTSCGSYYDFIIYFIDAFIYFSDSFNFILAHVKIRNFCITIVFYWLFYLSLLHYFTS